MPPTLQVALIVLGGILLLIGIAGGNIKLFGSEVVATVSNRLLRFVAFTIGALLLILAISQPGLDKPVPTSSETTPLPSPKITSSVEESSPAVTPSPSTPDSSVAPPPSPSPLPPPTPLPSESSGIPTSPATDTSTQSAETPLISWSDTVNNLSLRQSTGLKFTFRCPPSRDPITRLYGTDIYTGHSSICEAAVHSGVITQEQGGVVTIEVYGDQQSFVGSQRAGVLSKGYGRYYSSFVVIP